MVGEFDGGSSVEMRVRDADREPAGRVECAERRDGERLANLAAKRTADAAAQQEGGGV